MLNLQSLLDRIIDLDDEKNCDAIIVIKDTGGKERTLDRHAIMRLLQIESEFLGSSRAGCRGDNGRTAPTGTKKTTRNLAGVGVIVARMHREGRKKLDPTHLIKVLESFDGDISGRRTSKIMLHLNEILEWKLPEEVEKKVLEFMANYSELPQGSNSQIAGIH